MTEASDEGHILRTFWHGGPLGNYQILCLRSFVARGHRIELFSYEDGPGVPEWIVRKDAREILPAERVLHYRSQPGQGSPALHANLFRYAMLYQLGGWWVDTDVLLLRSQLPSDSIFFAAERPHSANTADPPLFGNAILKLPRQHPLLSEAVERCLAVGEAATWGQTGPRLFTELINKHQLARYASPQTIAYPISYFDVGAFFRPDRCDQARSRCKDSTFVHLWNEIWRRRGIPTTVGPPPGSFLDWLVSDIDPDLRFHGRLEVISRQLPVVSRFSWPLTARQIQMTIGGPEKQAGTHLV